MKQFDEAILYLKSLIVILESLADKSNHDDYIKVNIGILNDVQGTIGKLITNLQKMDN
tara:strand:+ start:247 stop:420 length:174 start_codon:yes stop_codon:yes gene_type:complete